MIETSNPEIDVAELMQRVRAEAAQIAERSSQPRSSVQFTRTLPPMRVLPPPPAPVPVRPVNLKRDRLDELLRRARQATEVAKWVPKFLRGLFRSQSGYNRHLLDLVTSLVKTNSELANRVRDLGQAVEAQGRWLNTVAERRTADQTWMRAVERKLGLKSSALLDQGERDALHGQLDRLGTQVVNLQNELNSLRASAVLPDQLRPLERQIEQVGLQVNHLQVEIGKNSSEARLAQRALEQITSRRSSIEQQLTRLDERVSSDTAFLKAIVAEHAALLPRLAGDDSAPLQG